MNCYQAKAGELAKQWYAIDASGQVVGRLAAQIAPILMGKHRPTYTPHIDTGDYVIVTNVDKVIFTGNKWQEKTYQRYSGYPGGQRDEAAWKLFERQPERILELAIQRMMPKSKLGRQMMDKLKLYVGTDHPHQAQGPIPLEALSGRPLPAGALFAPAAGCPGGSEAKEGREESGRVHNGHSHRNGAHPWPRLITTSIRHQATKRQPWPRLITKSNQPHTLKWPPPLSLKPESWAPRANNPRSLTLDPDPDRDFL